MAMELVKRTIVNSGNVAVQRTQEAIVSSSSNETNSETGNVNDTCNKNDGKCCQWSLEPLKESRTYLNEDTKGKMSEEDFVVERFKQLVFCFVQF